MKLDHHDTRSPRHQITMKPDHHDTITSSNKHLDRSPRLLLLLLLDELLLLRDFFFELSLFFELFLLRDLDRLEEEELEELLPPFPRLRLLLRLELELLEELRSNKVSICGMMKQLCEPR